MDGRQLELELDQREQSSKIIVQPHFERGKAIYKARKRTCAKSFPG